MSSIQPHLSHPKYRPDIDGLRAIAVLSVVVFHAFPSFVKGGFVGVDVFFVISGYLISTIIFENLDKGTFSFTEFYARRIRRIFPALILVLVASYAFGWFALLADEYKQLGKHTAAGAGFVSNIVLWNEAGYFDNSAETKPLLHLWSLGIEEQFYIIWPLLLGLAWKRKFNLLLITVLVAIASFYLNVRGIKKDDAVAAFYSPQTRFWELLSGSLLAWLTLYKTERLTSIRTRLGADGKTLSNIVSFIGLFLLGYGFWGINKEFSFPGWWAIVPVLGAVLIILSGANVWINRTLLSNKLAVWFGLISFPLYLWHWPLLSFARIAEGGDVPSRTIRIGAVLLSIVLAWLTYKLVERPLRLGNHSRSKVISLALLMAIVGYVGYNTYSRDGIQSRPIAQKGSKITEARSDWHYRSTKLEGGKITDINYLSGRKSDSVLFIGSSLMGQYYPRANAIYSSSKPDLSAIYVSRSHCTPIPKFDVISGPENINCQEYYRAALDLARDKTVVKVVFGANWPDLYVDGVLTEQGELFIRDLSELRKIGKDVYIVSKPPIYRGLAPSVKYFWNRPDWSLPDSYVDRDLIEDINSLEQLRKIASLSGAKIINPFDYLCDAKKCPIIRDGDFLYYDGTHIRAKYAEADATFIDDLVGR